jgi:hypothetical protein
MRFIRSPFSPAPQPEEAARIGQAGSTTGDDAMSASTMNQRNSGYELRFRSLFQPGRGLSFECDSSGNVDLDGMSERARENYLYARTVIGREYFIPMVRRCDLH